MKALILWWHERKEARHQDAMRRGYCWAWEAYRWERKSIHEIEAYLDLPMDTSTAGRLFDQGAERALDDIRLFQRALLRERSEA